MPEDGLPANVSKVIALKWIAFHVLEPFWGAARADAEPLHDALCLLNRLCRNELKTEAHQGSCQEWLTLAASKLEEASLAKDATPICRVALNRLASRLRSPGDITQFAINRLMDEALAASAAAYETHGHSLPTDLVASTVQRLTWTSESPTLNGTIFGGGSAQTWFREWPQTIVELELMPRKLDAETIAALPYVLVHEFVCHALQGPWSHDRISSDESSQFSEGWMDHVAFRILKRVLWSREVASRLDVRLSKVHVEAAALAVHKSRAEWKPLSEIDLSWAGRHLGIVTAHAVVESLFGLTDSEERALDLFVAASIRLNVAALRPTRRDSWVMLAHSCVVNDETDRVSRALIDYVEDGDLDRLFEGVA